MRASELLLSGECFFSIVVINEYNARLSFSVVFCGRPCNANGLNDPQLRSSSMMSGKTCRMCVKRVYIRQTCVCTGPIETSDVQSYNFSTNSLLECGLHNSTENALLSCFSHAVGAS